LGPQAGRKEALSRPFRVLTRVPVHGPALVGIYAVEAYIHRRKIDQKAGQKTVLSWFSCFKIYTSPTMLESLPAPRDSQGAGIAVFGLFRIVAGCAAQVLKFLLWTGIIFTVIAVTGVV